MLIDTDKNLINAGGKRYGDLISLPNGMLFKSLEVKRFYSDEIIYRELEGEEDEREKSYSLNG